MTELESYGLMIPAGPPKLTLTGCTAEYEVRATAQEVVREDGATRVKLTIESPAVVLGPFSVTLPAPVQAQAGETVVIEMRWPTSPQPVIVGDPVTVQSDMVITSAHGWGKGIAP